MSVVLDLDELIERVAARVVELLADRLPAAPADVSPWLNVDEAAEYLRCGPRRIYDLVGQRRLPAHRDGSRLLFRREELDEYVLEQDATDSLSVRRSRAPATAGDSGRVSARRQRRAGARST